MKNSSKTAQLDSLSGVVAAFEGIQDACTLLNGPIGCKTHLGLTSNLLGSHVVSVEPVSFKDCYFGQPRLPCTFIDEHDFVYGTEERLTHSLRLLDTKGYRLIGIVNHSGAALIGDDVSRIIQKTGTNARTMIVESSGFTGTYADGFKTGTIKILERLATKPKETRPKSVNIIGPTIFHYNWKNDVAELRQTLKTIGVEVISVICAGESIQNLERAGESALNLVIYEEYADSIARYLEKEFGTPYAGLSTPGPFGLRLSEEWFSSIADFFHLSHESLELTSRRVRGECFQTLSKRSRTSTILRGAPFAIFGDSSQVFPLTTFLYEYLGLYPALIGLKEVGKNSYDALLEFIASNSLDTSVLIKPNQFETIDCIKEQLPMFVFGSNIEEQLLLMLEDPPEFIPISYPNNGRTLLTMRPLIGFQGVFTLVEDVLNSFRHYHSIRKNLPL